MNLDRTLFWIAMISCAALLARTLPPWRQQRRGAGWVVVGAAILVVGGAAEIFFPAYAGVLVGTLWAVFIVLPSLLIRALLRHALGQRYARAERFARVVRWLHPADGWRETPALYHALSLAQEGQRERAADLFMGLMQRPDIPPQVAETARVYLYRMQGRWEELLAWTEGSPAIPGTGERMQSEGGCQTGCLGPGPQRAAHAGARPRRNRAAERHAAGFPSGPRAPGTVGAPDLLADLPAYLVRLHRARDRRG